MIQKNAKKIDQLKKENMHLIRENTKNIDQLKTENPPLIEKNTKLIDQLKTEIENMKTEHSLVPQLIEQNKNLIKQLEEEVIPRSVVMLVRKPLSESHWAGYGRQEDYFDQDFSSYQWGFS